MSDFENKYIDSLNGYTKNMSTLTHIFQGMYPGESYMSLIQSARKFSEEMQGIYSSSDYVKSIQSVRKMAEVFRLSLPKVNYNQSTLNSLAKLAEIFSKSCYANVENKKMYDSLLKNFATELKFFEEEDYRRMGEILKQNTLGLNELSSNLQRAASAVQKSKYKNLDEIEGEIYDDYSSDIELMLVGELTADEIMEKNEKSKGIFAKLIYWFIKFILITFGTGYIGHLFEPVYELIDNVVVIEDIADLSKEIGLPAKGTKITVGTKEDGYVEISYEDKNGSVQGYISEDDFNNKAELVQDALDVEKVIFISNCTLSMSEYWKVDTDETNKRLNEDFDIIREYIIPEYDRLVELATEDLVLDIDIEYKRQQNKKIENGIQRTSNYSDDELRFVVFCIESLAEDMNVDPVIVHDALTKESDIVDQYIIPCYETLHTQGKEYIIENLKEVMEERGIAL